MVTSKNRKRLVFRQVIAGLGLIVLASFFYSYFSLKTPTLPSPPLKELAKSHGIDLGMLVYDHRLNDRVYPDLVSSQFGFAVIDGGAHFKELRPSKDAYDYTTADRIVAFAKGHGMPVQLHHLMWGDKVMLPDWLLNGNFTKQQLQQIQKDHITNVMKHFKGKVREYSVINEAFTEEQHKFGLSSWFAEQLGNDRQNIDNYFIWARQADPSAKLIINDFNNETKNKISDAMYTYVNDAKARGIPIDGVGMQMHINASNVPAKQDLIDNMKRFKDLGTPVYITEFDVNSNAIKGSDTYKNQLEATIAYDVARACIESKACVSFTVFGLTQKNEVWKDITRVNSRDLLFNSRYQPQPSFYEFRRAWDNP